MSNWDIKFINLARNIASWSKDRSTKVGCVIVGPSNEIRTTGFNGIVRGCNDNIEARHERPLKYSWFEHAERNAIFNAARMGNSLDGCTLYLACDFRGPPCVDCTRALIQSGIRRIVGVKGDDNPDNWNDRWKESMAVSLEMIKEAGIIFDTIEV